MTLKEAVLRSLQELRKLATHMDVYTHIIKNNHYDFGDAKTPAQTISATLGDFIRKGDSRVKRVKNEKRNFTYYLSTLEGEIGLEKTQLIETEQKIMFRKKHIMKEIYIYF